MRIAAAMPLAAAVIVPLLSVFAPAPAFAQSSTPAGWKAERVGGGAAVRYAPPDLNPGEVYHVTVYPRATLGSDPLGEWTLLQAAADADPPGAAAGEPKLQSKNENVAGVVRVFNAGGKAVAAAYTAVSTDGENVRLVRVVFSGQEGLFDRYKVGTQAISTGVVDDLKRLAKGSGGGGGGTSGPAPGAGRGGVRPGGAPVAGVYAGDQVYHSTWGKRDKDVRNRFRLHLYANGEFRLCDENDKQVEFGKGRYSYDPATGKINIGRTFQLTNSSIDPDEDFCFLGRDAAGKPYLYGENDRGLGLLVTSLRYAGPIKRPSPETEERAEAAAEAEARRYKHVVPPGKGIKDSQIAAVVHHYDVQVYSAGVNGIGTNVTDEAFLLLKDGTAYNGLPVAPDQMDVARSRKREPGKWGRWRRQGKKFLVAWPDKPGQFRPLPGYAVLPGKPGTRLQGRWGAGSSSASLAGSSYSLWGVTFTKDGRFKKDRRGGSGNGTFMQMGGQPAINTTYDDNGSFTSATGPGMVVTAGRKNNPNGDREGTYSIEGFALTLRYDNGQVARMPFFFGNAKQSVLWFEGNQLGRDDDKD